MDAKELNIGDLVYCRSIGGRHAKVTENYAQLQPPFKRMVRLSDGGLTWCVPIDEVEPIPITEEMLKANDFIMASECEGLHYRSYSIRDLTVYWHTEADVLSVTVGDISIGMHYVHLLQHLLRLSGRGDIADKFKTETHV